MLPLCSQFITVFSRSDNKRKSFKSNNIHKVFIQLLSGAAGLELEIGVVSEGEGTTWQRTERPHSLLFNRETGPWSLIVGRQWKRCWCSDRRPWAADEWCSWASTAAPLLRSFWVLLECSVSRQVHDEGKRHRVWYDMKSSPFSAPSPSHNVFIGTSDRRVSSLLYSWLIRVTVVKTTPAAETHMDKDPESFRSRTPKSPLPDPTRRGGHGRVLQQLPQPPPLIPLPVGSCRHLRGTCRLQLGRLTVLGWGGHAALFPVL